MERVHVALGARSYSILVGSGLLPELSAHLRELASGGRSSERAAIITDSKVGPLHAATLASSLRRADFSVVEIQIPEGEQHKNMAWLAFVYDRLIEGRIERSSPVFALGGGVVGDLGGLAAATFLRGVPLIQVPTSLLAQVDAAVGGKTAVNHAAGKNLIGAFYQPRLVAVDVDTLKTLPRREYVSGLAEVVKYGVILDPELFALLEEHAEAVLRHEPERMIDLISRCCRLKATVVEEDETEGDYRAVLNFGHTVGHAIETLTDYRRYLHGEAVSIGMICAARLSRRQGWFDRAAEERLERLLRKFGLPTDVPPELRSEDIAIAISADKKAARDKIRFVGVDAIGKTRFAFMTAAEIASAAL